MYRQGALREAGPGEVTWKLRPQRRLFQEEEHEVRRPKVWGWQAGGAVNMV